MCPDPWAQWHFEQSITKVCKFLQKMQTEPHIANIICEQLLAWQQGWDLVPATGSFFGLVATVHLQDKLGWWAFIEGAPCKGWAETQQCYYEFIGSRWMGQHWLSAVIRKMWDTSWDMWEHHNGILHNQDDSILLRQLEEDI
jgi:hypothetical protein